LVAGSSPAGPTNPSRRPSRFRAGDILPGIFYASEDVETAETEAAHWRLLVFTRSPGFRRPRTPTPLSAFSVLMRAERLLNLLASALRAAQGRGEHCRARSGGPDPTAEEPFKLGVSSHIRGVDRDA
jgi:hypothetical protein